MKPRRGTSPGRFCYLFRLSVLSRLCPGCRQARAVEVGLLEPRGHGRQRGAPPEHPPAVRQLLLELRPSAHLLKILMLEGSGPGTSSSWGTGGTEADQGRGFEEGNSRSSVFCEPLV